MPRKGVPKVIKHSLIALAVMGMALFSVPATDAMALTVPAQVPAVAGSPSALMTDVKNSGSGYRGGYRGGSGYRGYHGRPGYYHGNRHYNRYHHGYRCNSWSRNCRHYYHGYWYQNPWWTYPAVGIGIGLGAGAYYYDDYYVPPPRRAYGSRHVRWCMDRYRSYNARTNTWVAYSGRVNQCISPYGP